MPSGTTDIGPENGKNGGGVTVRSPHGIPVGNVSKVLAKFPAMTSTRVDIVWLINMLVLLGYYRAC